MAAEPSSSITFLKAFRTSIWVVTSSAVVGSSSTSRLGFSTSAIAAIRRCSWPPETWCGIAPADPVGVGQFQRLVKLAGAGVSASAWVMWPWMTADSVTCSLIFSAGLKVAAADWAR